MNFIYRLIWISEYFTKMSAFFQTHGMPFHLFFFLAFYKFIDFNHRSLSYFLLKYSMCIHILLLSIISLFIYLQIHCLLKIYLIFKWVIHAHYKYFKRCFHYYLVLYMSSILSWLFFNALSTYLKLISYIIKV